MKNIRTCIACRNKFDKSQVKMHKITLCENEFKINEGNLFGRSVYICKNDNCINKVVKNKILNKVFKNKVNEDIYENINSLKG